MTRLSHGADQSEIARACEAARFERLLSRLAHYNMDQPETVPLWASLLSLPLPDRFAPLNLSPVRQREETFRLLLDWLHVRASRGPVLFIVEDLHWIDASTLEFLGLLLGEFEHDSVLIVLTFSPEFQPPWSAASQHTSLALTRLNRRQVGDLMRQQAGSMSDAVIGVKPGVFEPSPYACDPDFP